MKSIYKFDADCGRMGALTGIFVAKSSEVKELVESDKVVYFGECLGKHSEITFKVKEDHITQVTADQALVSIFEQHDMETGINPVQYYQDALEDGLYGDEEE